MHSIVQTLQRRTILGLRGQLNAGYWTHLNANWFDFQCLKIEANGGLGGRQSITASLKRTHCFKLVCQSRIIQLIQLMFWYHEILILLKWIIQRWQMIFATLCTCIYVIDLFLPENCKKENRNLNQHWASLVAFVRGTYCRHMLLVVGIIVQLPHCTMHWLWCKKEIFYASLMTGSFKLKPGQEDVFKH